ncbi:PRC-barrel domain-containing protein [Undibacterium sp. SXout7W]|uniref:PRC-barrel domain-containing protein n=1 Tax=Undibacterium sp. SXout7W TaxID=3413049 RepID=UPI003BF40B88
MKKILSISSFVVVSIAMMNISGYAQVAGSTTIGVTVTEAKQLALGWSVSKSILGKEIYSDTGTRIGKIEDLIISPEKNLSYLIIGVGGFIGIGRHNVAIPVSQIVEQHGKLTLPGATKDSIKALPQFDYAGDTAKRDAFVMRTEQDLIKAKEKVVELQKKSVTLNGEAKVKLEQQYTTLQQRIQSTENKLGEMKRASVNRWREFESDLSSELAHLKQTLSDLEK